MWIQNFTPDQEKAREVLLSGILVRCQKTLQNTAANTATGNFSLQRFQNILIKQYLRIFDFSRMSLEKKCTNVKKKKTNKLQIDKSRFKASFDNTLNIGQIKWIYLRTKTITNALENQKKRKFEKNVLLTYIV